MDARLRSMFLPKMIAQEGTRHCAITRLADEAVDVRFRPIADISVVPALRSYSAAISVSRRRASAIRAVRPGGTDAP